MTKTTGFRTS